MTKGSVEFFPMVPLLSAAEESSLSGTPSAIGAFNVNFYTQALGILEGLRRAEAPGIIQASRGANKFQGGPEKIAKMVLDAMEHSKHPYPVTLHLDHGDTEKARECVNSGYSSVMIDASQMDLDENISVTKSIAEYAHSKGISVEGEFGRLKGVEEDIVHEKTTYADPYLVPYFFHETGVDALAIAYGTSHGPNKGSGLERLAIDVVDMSYRGMRAYGQNQDHFLVSHGSSTVPHELVEELNSYGGKIKDASGIPMEKIQEAISAGVRKINIDTDLRLTITAAFRKYFLDNPGVENSSPDVLKPIKKILDEDRSVIDPRAYLKAIDISLLRRDPAGTDLEEIMEIVKERIAHHVEMLVYNFGSAGLAGNVKNVTVERMKEKYGK